MLLLLALLATAPATELFWNGEPTAAPPAELVRAFPEEYSEVPGVLTFRGSGRRTGGAWGTRQVAKAKLEVVWTALTGKGTPRWGGGAGWTGEPVIIKWPEATRRSMRSLWATAPDELVEVIQGSLDGNVYFLDLHTGARTRRPLATKNPIKGSVAVDPRGFPLLFVGQGIPAQAPLGLRIYDLGEGKELFFLPGRDPLAPRRWGAFDGSGLINRDSDSFFTGAENGLLYAIKLNTKYEAASGRVELDPEVLRYRMPKARRAHHGVESSIAVARGRAYFADNGGTISALELSTFTPLWHLEAGDDTDASLTIDEEDGRPVLYTGSEVDKQGRRGLARLRKLDGDTGKELWRREVPCRSVKAPRHSDGGALATNLVGEGDIDHLVIFTLSRCDSLRSGLILALHKETGDIVWEQKLSRYAWSSPTAVPSRDGHTYMLQADVSGVLHLLDARDGTTKDRLRLRGVVEASPAVYDDMIVLVSRARRIYGIRIL